MDTLLLDNLLETVKAEKAQGRGRGELFDQIHTLAEAEYLPALDFFITLLEDTNWDWRLEGVQVIGFHFQFEPDSQLADRFRFLLLNDESALVRGAAALVLGARSTALEPSLLRVLSDEPDFGVHLAAFEALLWLEGIPHLVAGREVDNHRNENSRVSIEEFKKIAKRLKANA